MGQRGPKEKITDELFESIVQSVIAGGTRKQACAIAGVSTSTLWSYLKQRPKFRLRLDAARETSNFGLVGHVYDAAGKDWKAAAWLLERRDREHFGRRDADALPRAQVIQLVTRAVQIAVELVPKEYQLKVDEAIQSMFEGLQADGVVAEQ